MRLYRPSQDRRRAGNAVRLPAQGQGSRGGGAARKVPSARSDGRAGAGGEAAEPVWTQFPPEDSDDLALYEAVRGLSDHDLDQLETLLTALVFGQEICQRLDTGDSLFNRVARDLCIDMRYHWRPDRSFLERRSRDQLAAIAVDCGYTEGAGRVASYKKAELVNSLLWYFET